MPTSRMCEIKQKKGILPEIPISDSGDYSILSTTGGESVWLEWISPK